jgi:hypothetical protein
LYELNLRKVALLCVTVCALSATSEAQQLWTDKAFVNVSGGGQVGSHTLNATSTFDLYDEQGTLTTSGKVKGGGLFDVSAGYRAWDNLTLGIGYSWAGGTSKGDISASVPDPAFRGRLRSVTAAGPGLSHAENVINLFGAWMIPLRDKIDVGVSFGPSIFIVKQEVPDTVTVTEPGPSISAIGVRKVTKTTGGLNAGVDVSYMVTKRFGAGVLLRYTWGSVGLGDGSDDLTVGGFQVGGGLRVRFSKLPWE